MEGVKNAPVLNQSRGGHQSSAPRPKDLPEGGESDRRELDVLTRSVMSRFEQYVKLNKKIPAGDPEPSLSGIDSPEPSGRTPFAAQMTLKLSEKQKVLEDFRRCGSDSSTCFGLIDAENRHAAHRESGSAGRVKQQMEKSQREYYLNEQMKAIQKELGEMEDSPNEFGRARAEDQVRWHAEGPPKRRPPPSSTS